MTTGVANPFSTGGGGVSFENQVQAAALAAMLCNIQLPWYPNGKIRSIRFQGRQAGYHTDDLVMIISPEGARPSLVLCQLKHQLSFNRSDTESVSVLTNALKDFNKRGTFKLPLDSIVIVTGIQSTKTEQHIKTVPEWARTCASEKEFIDKISTPRFSAEEKVAFVDLCRGIASELGGVPFEDRELWQFMRLLRIRTYDFSLTDSHYRALSIFTIQTASSLGCPVGAEDIWNSLLGLCSRLNQSAGTVDAKNLREVLPTAILDWYQHHRNVSIGPLRDRFIQHSEANFNRVRTEFLAGATLKRDALIEHCVEALRLVQVIVVSGEAGGGKSAIAKMVSERLAEDGPAFLLRCEEFNYPSLHSCFSAFGACESLDEIVAKFGMLNINMFVVDGIEKLLEIEHRHAFLQFLDLVYANASWRLILTCRSHALNTLNMQIFNETSLRPFVVEIPPLDDSELTYVATIVPSIAAYMANDRVREVLKTPQYLRIACLLPMRSLTNAAIHEPEDIRQALWKAAVRNDVRVMGSLPARREQAFIELARTRATAMQPSVPRPRELDQEALEALIADGIVDQFDDGGVAPAHDLFEDWALREYVQRQFEEAQGQPEAVFERVGTAPAIRRAFRFWLRGAIDGSGGQRICDFAVEACRTTAVAAHWRDDLLTGALQGHNVATFLGQIEPQLLEHDRALLKRATHLLKTACRGPNVSLLSMMKVPKQLHDQLGLHLSVPVGPGWGAVVKFVDRIRASLVCEDIQLVSSFLWDWTKGRGIEKEPADVIHAAARVVLHLADILDKEPYNYRNDYKILIAILFRCASQAGDDIRTLFQQVRAGERSPALAEELSNTAISSFESAPLCKHAPDVVFDAVRMFTNHSKLSRQRSRRSRSYDSDRSWEAAFGLDRIDEYKFAPASACKGPWLFLLTDHEQEAIDFIVDFVNGCIDAFIEYSGGKAGIFIELAGLQSGARRIFGSRQLWCLYRGTQVGPYMLTSCLMAFEAHLIAQAQAGRNLEELALHVLNRTNSVALLSPLVSIALFNRDCIGEAVFSLISNLAFLQWDKERMILDQGHVSDIGKLLGIPDDFNAIFNDERSRADKMEHRKRELETLVVELQFTDAKDRVFGIIDAMRADFGQGVDVEGVAGRMVFKRTDLREWTVLGEQDGEHLIGPKVDEPALKSAVAESDAKMARMNHWLGLQGWAVATFRREDKAAQFFEDWREPLRRAMQAPEEQPGESVEDDGWDQSFATRACVASVVVRDHAEELHHEELGWCLDRMAEALEGASRGDAFSVSHSRNPLHGSRLAAACLTAALKIAVRDDPLFHRVRSLYVTALTHPNDEVQHYAAINASPQVWEIDRELAETCFKGLLWLATASDRAIEQHYASRVRKDLRSSLRDLETETRTRILSNVVDLWDTREFQLKYSVAQTALLALLCVPLKYRDDAYIHLLGSCLTDIVDAERREDGRQPREARLAQEYEFHAVFPQIWAATFFASNESQAANMRRSLLEALQVAVKICSQIMNELISSVDRNHDIERFWFIWTPLAQLVFDREAKLWSRGYGRHDLVRILLFANTSWKPNADSWKPLDQQSDFIYDAIRLVGNTEAGFASVVRLLTTIGKSLVPDVIIELEAARQQARRDLLGDANVRYDLEIVLREIVFRHGSAVRSREVMRAAVLRLLDDLVEHGSPLAFQLREFIIAPSRAA